MLLEKKNAVVYGGGGAVGGAVARAFAREGAHVFLAGRTIAPLDAVAGEISDAGGRAESAQVDILDEAAVEEHGAAVDDKTGHLDVSFNAIGIPQRDVQGTPLLELSPESFSLPITTYTRAHFLTASHRRSERPAQAQIPPRRLRGLRHRNDHCDACDQRNTSRARGSARRARADRSPARDCARCALGSSERVRVVDFDPGSRSRVTMHPEFRVLSDPWVLV